MTPWDQRIARVLVRPLARTAVTPNHLTALSLGVSLWGAWLLSVGTAPDIHWGVGLFVFGRFLDHFDGELARLTGRTSKLGYYFDYGAGALSYLALFSGAAVGLWRGPLGEWALLLGLMGAVAAVAAMWMGIRIDRLRGGEDAVGYPGYGGFELEDGIYLIAPVTWLGFLPQFFALAGVGATVFAAYTGVKLVRLARAT